MRKQLLMKKDALIDLLNKEVDEESFFQDYFMKDYEPVHENIEKFADEVSNSFANPSDMTYVYRFLIVAVQYIIEECHPDDWSFVGLNKLIKATKKDAYDDGSTFDCLMHHYVDKTKESLLKSNIDAFSKVERFCEYPKRMYQKLPIAIYDWRNTKEKNQDTTFSKISKMDKVLEFAKKTFRE